MGEKLSGLKRSHYCGQVDESMIGNTVTVMGWVNKRRDLGQLIFIALRDRSGLLQVTVDEKKVEPDLFLKAETIRGEFVVAAVGKVIARTAENINENMKTGRIEVEVSELRILSEAQVPPFSVMDEGVGNDLRLKYRYIDLRRPELFRNLKFRSDLARIVREFFLDEGFLEIETPMLTRSTPEGARDFLVPSRLLPQNFYALPQSPQIFKQILMVANMDKYFQIVKCFRDEDFRADRQPEFTQIDVECSFVDEDDIIGINERLIQKSFKKMLNVDISLPIQRMTYKEAMERFGSDKPDIRFSMELKNITEIVKGSEFSVFEDAIKNGGSVRGICAEGCADFPRRQIDALVDFVKDYKAKGLATIALNTDGTIKTSISKFFSEDEINKIVEAFCAKPGDLILICADKNKVVFDSLGALRVEVAKRLGLLKADEFKFLWVTEFPLLEWSEEDSRFYAMHHPFTATLDEDIELLFSDKKEDLERIRAKAYDIVLNGTEMGGGSIRIHQKDVQDAMFKALGFTREAAESQFSFLLEAFKYGVPPHGGIAYGLDRMVMLMLGTESIRDVMAFPKVKDGSCPMTNAPSLVEASQLDILGIQLKKAENN